jgi:hypothetical protein
MANIPGAVDELPGHPAIEGAAVTLTKIRRGI